MTLDEWAEQWGMTFHRTRGGIIVYPDRSLRSYRELWRLSDYAVVGGGVHYVRLEKRRRRQPGPATVCVFALMGFRPEWVAGWMRGDNWQDFLRRAAEMRRAYSDAGYCEHWLEIDGKRLPIEFLPRPERQLTFPCNPRAVPAT